MTWNKDHDLLGYVIIGMRVALYDFHEHKTYRDGTIQGYIEVNHKYAADEAQAAITYGYFTMFDFLGKEGRHDSQTRGYTRAV